MKTAPLISVIIPVKGRYNYVKEAINSIYQQHDYYKNNTEIIVVEENNYTEIIGKRLKELFPEIITLRNKDKEGPGGGRNTGLRIARGKYIVFLDSDDQLKKGFLSIVLSKLSKDKKCAAAVCFSDSFFYPYFSLTEKIKLYLLMLVRDINLIFSYLINSTYLFKTAFYLCQISHMMFKTEKIRKIRFNYDYRRGGEDWDFFIQTMSLGPIKIIPKKLLLFRYSQNSSTSSPLNRKLKWLSYSKLASRLPNHMKKSIYYQLFISYIKIFKVNND